MSRIKRPAPRLIPALALLVAASIGEMAVTGCATAPKVPASARLAVVSFSLQRSITKSGESYDLGPLIPDQQKSYYQYHQESVDKAWAVFKSRAAAIFAPRTLVDFQSIEGSAPLAALAAPPAAYKSLSLGLGLDLDFTASGQRVMPAGMNYLSLWDAGKNAKVARLFGADYIVAIDLQADYSEVEGLSFGAMTKTQARMNLTANIGVADASGKVIRRATVVGVSRDTATIGPIGSPDEDLDRGEFPRLILSAQDDLLRHMAKEVARW